jgi:hypothetical protein
MEQRRSLKELVGSKVAALGRAGILHLDATARFELQPSAAPAAAAPPRAAPVSGASCTSWQALGSSSLCTLKSYRMLWPGHLLWRVLTEWFAMSTVCG